MTDSANSEASVAAQPSGEQGQPRKKRGSGKRGGRPPEQSEGGRPSRARGEKSVMSGFGDGLDRAVCSAVVHQLPSVFPANHRSGLASGRLLTVARKADALLLCDGRHDGPHVWPNGDLVNEASGDVEPLIGVGPDPGSSPA